MLIVKEKLYIKQGILGLSASLAVLLALSGGAELDAKGKPSPVTMQQTAASPANSAVSSNSNVQVTKKSGLVVRLKGWKLKPEAAKNSSLLEGLCLVLNALCLRRNRTTFFAIPVLSIAEVDLCDGRDTVKLVNGRTLSGSLKGAIMPINGTDWIDFKSVSKLVIEGSKNKTDLNPFPARENLWTCRDLLLDIKHLRLASPNLAFLIDTTAYIDTGNILGPHTVSPGRLFSSGPNSMEMAYPVTSFNVRIGDRSRAISLRNLNSIEFRTHQGCAISSRSVEGNHLDGRLEMRYFGYAVEEYAVVAELPGFLGSCLISSPPNIKIARFK